MTAGLWSSCLRLRQLLDVGRGGTTSLFRNLISANDGNFFAHIGRCPPPTPVSMVMGAPSALKSRKNER